MEDDFKDLLKAEFGDIKSCIHTINGDLGDIKSSIDTINGELGQMVTKGFLKEQMAGIELEMAKMLPKNWFLATALTVFIGIIVSIFAGLQFFMQLLVQLT